MAYTRTGYANFAAFPVTGAANIIYVDLSNGNEYTWVSTAYAAYTGTLAGIRTAYQTSAWFSANGSILLGKGQRVDLEQTGLFKLGDGVTLLSALEFKSSATHKDTAWFTANAAVVIEDKRLIYCSDGANQGKYKIGDGTTALSSLVFYGGISASGLTVGTTTITGGTSGRVMYNNAGVVGEYAVTGTGSAVLSTSPTFVTNLTVNGNVAGVILSEFKNTNTGGYSVVRTSSDTGNSLAELTTFNSAGTTGGLYVNETPVLSLYKANGYGLIINEATNGNIKFAVGGYAAGNERLNISPTVTQFKTNTINLDSGTASRIMATDASKNVQFLDTATYPSLTELSYVKSVTSAIQTQLDSKYTTVACYGSVGTVQFTASSTTYWSTMIVPASSLRGTVGQSLTSLPYSATLVGATILTWNASSGTSQTNSTLYFRLNGADNTISSTVLWSASAATSNVQNVTGLNVAVTAGTTWELKLVMGALATAPINAAQCNVILYFKY